MTLPLCSTFIYGLTELHLSLPITPWTPSQLAVGGDIDSDVGIRASFVIHQREVLGFAIRFHEGEWSGIQQWIEAVQDGTPFHWIPDPFYLNYPEFTDVVLEEPAVNAKYEVIPDPQYPRVLQLPVVIGRVGLATWDLREITS